MDAGGANGVSSASNKPVRRIKFSILRFDSGLSACPPAAIGCTHPPTGCVKAASPVVCQKQSSE